MKLIVNFTPTGMIPTKQLTPHVPISVAEIVEDVHQALEIGITMVHLHAREVHDGSPTYKAEVYGPIIEGVRKLDRDLIICVSLSGRSFKALEQRAEPLQLGGEAKPDMGSLTLASLNFARQASDNAPDIIQGLCREMQARGVLPELEAFDLGMLNYARYLEGKGLLRPPHYVNLLFGNIASAQTDLLHIGAMLRDLLPRSFWSLAGLGDSQLSANAVAIAAGGGVRVGLEDNIWLDRGRQRLARNAELLRRVHDLAALHERELMPASELRAALELEPGQGRYGRPSPS